VTTPLFPPTGGAYVLDTSAAIDIKKVERRVRDRVLKALTAMAKEGRLFYPREVLSELERYVPPSGQSPDELAAWARSCGAWAASIVATFATVRRVLERVPLLVDPDLANEEADPYVLALALELRGQGYDVVVTYDHRNRPNKLSLASACGLFRVPRPCCPFWLTSGFFLPAVNWLDAQPRPCRMTNPLAELESRLWAPSPGRTPF
jgi:hypothetical protein